MIVALGMDTFQPSVVRGASMLPNLKDGERILVESMTPRFGALARGDVVVLSPPGADGDRYVKRIAALPGDVLGEACGKLTINGAAAARDLHVARAFRAVVPENCYFVVGDNSDHSFDSRNFGHVPADRIIGRVVGK